MARRAVPCARSNVCCGRIASGGEETIQYTHPTVCPVCNGTRARPGTQPRQCDTCGGSGRKVITEYPEGGIRLEKITTCPICQGLGTIIDEPCNECNGQGQIDKQENLKVHIPAGIEEGTAIHLSGHGFPSVEPNGQAGDVYVTVRSTPDTRFDRIGANLWHTQMISVIDAVLGTHLEVQTLEGTLLVNIPPGTQPDQVLRLPGKGLPRVNSDSRGDLNLRIQVHIPESLTDKEHELYEQLGALNNNEQGKPH